ncbi:alpha/beta hydrolase [uncultured Shimia sp.]|uniref:alpha/beta fold hydrolase n=1 Tax=uncultured Shimia sp. TaxID=573152 RepID=UPI002606FDEA|nr:alpha/beta hydrolase [uncultured Shimia sp.]
MELFSQDFGTGPRKAIALHCSLAHSGAWKRVAQCLSEMLTIRAFDLPSHGKSPDWQGPEDLTQMTVDALLPHLTEPVDLIGHSFGGVVCLRLALERPEMVRSLSLFEPVLMAIAREDGPREAAWNDALMRDVGDQIARGDPEAGARIFMRVWGDGRRWADLPRDLREGSTRRIGFIASSRPGIDEDNGHIIPRLGRISVPTVLMDGGESPPLMKVVQDGIAARIPNARRVTFAGQAHMGPITHASDVAREIAVTLAEAG